MKYPMEECYDSLFGETFYREMSPATYDKKIQWFRDYIKSNENDKARRAQEYVSYLKRWFSDQPCDGLPSFKIRHTLHQLPMSYNMYFNG